MAAPSNQANPEICSASPVNMRSCWEDAHLLVAWIMCLQDMGRNGYSAPRALVERPVGLIRQHQQQQDQRQPPAAGDQPSAKELQLVGVQVGCVLGKAGENITQIRKVGLQLLSCCYVPAFDNIWLFVML